MTDTASPPLDSVAFLGGGQMARALIGGLRAAGQPASTLFVADVSPGSTGSVLGASLVLNGLQ